VATTKSTLSCWMNGSRLAETDSTHSMPLGWMPSSPAMILAISTSNPSRLPSRFFWPNSGWSNLVPTRTLPACWSRAMVEPSAKLAPPPAWPPPPSSPPQAAAPSIRATTVTTIPLARRVRIMGPSLSVADDLGEEVLCPLRPGVGEELLRRPLLQDLAGVHEHHPVGGRPGEPHLGRQRAAVQPDAATVDRLQPVDGAAQRRLARTGRA